MADKSKKKHSGHDDINEFFAEFDKVEKASGSGQSKGQGKAAAPRGSAPVQNPKSQSGASFQSTTNTKGKKKKKKKKHRVLKIILLIIVLAILAVVAYVSILIITAEKPNVDADSIYSKLHQRSTIYDDSGKKIESVFSQEGNRANVIYGDIPENLINAIVAIEDKTFWDHHGFNFIRIMGAIKESVFGGGQVSGTSTLTQQLARNIYLADRKSQRSLNRKILEAYYTVMIEQNLTKEQIVEAYLNTVYLGFNCYGVETASQAYFGKTVKNLDLLECVTLASLPQSPDAFALVKSRPVGTVEVAQEDVLAKSDNLVYAYNGEMSENRRQLTLKNMVDQGYISQSDADKALGKNLKKKMKVTVEKGSGFASYFTDYAIEQIIQDITEEYGWPRSEARKMVYNNGLKIYTTMNRSAQKVAVREFRNSSNFPGTTNLRMDSNSNILNDKTGKILLYEYGHYFNSKKQFVLKKSEYRKNSDGSLTLFTGKRLNFYNVTLSDGTEDISPSFKNMYTREDGKIYTIEGGALSIPQGYKTKDAAGNCTVSAKFFTDYPEFFKEKNGSLVVSEKNYSLQQKVVQPQAAMVIFDYKTGGIKAMVGGRTTTGKMLYNRATKPRQPGSSIKPIAVYSSALQMSHNAAIKGEGMSLSKSDGSSWGSYMTAGSVINDAPMVVNGRTWPKNWYTGYRGRMTLRTAVEQSVNVCAVKVYQQMGPEFPTSQLKKMGITTVVEDGATNDMNPAALALGGMTKGISPLEMSAAYGIFPNQGLYTEPVTYTKITNSNDEVLFEKTPKTEDVLDEGVAYIMTSILRSVVTNGLGRTASFSGQPVAGKTGTTTDNYDAWFVGFTPQYSAALWIGNDVNIELTEGSASAARLWRNIMSQVCAGMPYGEYPKQPDNVTRINGEFYTEGTYSKVAAPGNSTGSFSSETTTQQQTTRNVVTPTTRAPATQAPTRPSTTAAPTTQTPTVIEPPEPTDDSPEE